jgi:hypothetical protein
MKVKHEEKWFLVSNMEISKTLPRVTFWSDLRRIDA